MSDKKALSKIRKRNLKILKTQKGLFFRFKRKFKKNIEFKNALKIILSGFFDYEYYLNKYPGISNGNPSIMEAAIHYNTLGWRDAKNPSELFNNKVFIKYNCFFKKDKQNLLLEILDKDRLFNNKDLKNKYLKGDVKAEYDSSNQTLDSFLSYKKWIKSNESDTVFKDVIDFRLQPKISILITINELKLDFLDNCIKSILAQSYFNFQICILSDHSIDNLTKKTLLKYEESDKRIEIFFKESSDQESKGNYSLNLINGDWLFFVRSCDELQINALSHIVKTINKYPSTDLIYSDEDKIDKNGIRFKPHFKSEFNLDLLYSQNYISNIAVYKTTILKQIDKYRSVIEGCSNYDLLLRYLECINYQNIEHIPKVLYHSRTIKENINIAKNGVKALKSHLSKIDSSITVEKGDIENSYKVNWPIKNSPLISLIIPTYNGYEITKQAIDSILEKTKYKNYEIILVDNNSNDPIALEYFEKLKEHSKITVLKYAKPFNYSAINNFAVEYAKGEVFGLVNNDIEVINEGWLEEMLQHALRKDIGCVGAMLYYPNDTIQHAGVIIGLGGVACHSHKNFNRGAIGYYSRLKVVQNISAVTAACLLVRKEVYQQVNGLNEEDLKVAFNDVDLCLKIQKAGYRNLWTPYAELYHHESISRGVEDTPEKKARFTSEINYMKKVWNTHEFNDPYYNINLTRDSEDFSIRG